MNRLFPSGSFKDALEEQSQAIISPFLERLHVARRRAKTLWPLVQWIAKARLLRGAALLGPVLRSESYPPGERDGSPGMIFQSALVIPHGLGILHWDAEQLMSLPYQGETLESACWLAYVPFRECSPPRQALMVDAIIELAEQLLTRLRTELSEPLDSDDGI